MKNYDDEIALKTNFVSKKNIKSEKIKTTNINILLNRVRLDRKKTLQKKSVHIWISFWIWVLLKRNLLDNPFSHF